MIPDHARQVQIWYVIHSSRNKEPFQIRSTLTETSVRASDRRAIFVGVDAYEAAGGTMLHNPFQGDDDAWLEVRTLVDQPVTDDKGAAHAKLLAEQRALEDEFASQFEVPDKISTRLGMLETGMEKIETQLLIVNPTEIGRVEAFVTLDRSGPLAVYRGYMCADDEPIDETAVLEGVHPALGGQGDDRDFNDGYGSAASFGTVIMSGGQPIGYGPLENEDDGALKPLPERLVMELTAHRALSLSEAIGRSPDVALTPLLLMLSSSRILPGKLLGHATANC